MSKTDYTSAKIADLTGPALDYAVTRTLGRLGVSPTTCSGCRYHERWYDEGDTYEECQLGDLHWQSPGPSEHPFGPKDSDTSVHKTCPIKLQTKFESYSTDWSLAGPIVEREAISVSALYAQKSSPIPEFNFGEWGAYIPVGCNGIGSMSANTPLEAAMRCFVASKFGDEVEVPRQLIEPWLTQPQRNFNMPENSKVVQTPGNYFFAGVPVYVPNEVRQSDPQFYISHNSSYRDYGCPTTALVVQSPETSFYILCGDHRKAYEGKSLEECLAYFRENLSLQHEYSDKLL